jgi:hypothetical protein
LNSSVGYSTRNLEAMRDGRLLVLAKNEESAAKATKNLKNFYGTCDIKTTRMENMNTVLGTISREHY